MYVPQIDVFERQDELVILVEMPGIDRSDITISWRDKILTISGNKRQKPDAGNAKYMCVERSYGPFRREIAIVTPVDPRKARAELRNGLMSIHLPRSADEKVENTIPIE